MFHSFRFGLASLLLFYLQVEIQGGSPPSHQNLVSSNAGQNIPASPSNVEASVWRIPLHHQNTIGALVNAQWTTHGPQNIHEDQNGYGFRRVKRYESRIVGGSPAQPHEFPHQVYLSRPNRPCFCGGSIISKWLILTAAHCIRGRNVSSITVTAGAHDQYRPTGLEQIRGVDEMQIHPNYTRGAYNEENDDIAILVLSEPLAFSYAVRSIALPNRDAIFWENATVSGWGTTTSHGSSSSVLRKVTLPIVPNSQCNSQYAKIRITEQMLCAGGEEGQDACQGDSGGPALCTSGRWGLNRSSFLCGIVSFGKGCGLADYPGVYVKVSEYIGWILGVLNKRTLETDCLRDGLTQSNTADWTECVTKYALPQAEVTPCRTNDEEPGFLLLAYQTSVLRIALNQMDLAESVPLRTSVGYVKAVEFDLKKDYIYWKDGLARDIMRLHLNGNGQPEGALVSSGISNYAGLSFDWMSCNLYFTDNYQSRIGVIRTNGGLPGGFHGQIRKILLKKPDVNRPWGIVVHPEKGYIFWTDESGGNLFIGRAHLDGSHPTKIVSNDGSKGNTQSKYPRGISLDYINNRIYWADYHLGRIMTADLNGDDVKIGLQADSRVKHPIAVGIYKNTLYWTDRSTHASYKAPLQLDKTVKTNSISKIGASSARSDSQFDLKVYGAGSQQGENLCTNSNCSYICMVSPGPQRTLSCLCPDGFTKQNNDTCV